MKAIHVVYVSLLLFALVFAIDAFKKGDKGKAKKNPELPIAKRSSSNVQVEVLVNCSSHPLKPQPLKRRFDPLLLSRFLMGSSDY